MKPFLKEKTLYERIGGYDVIVSILDDFMENEVSDPQLKRFFEGGRSDESKMRTRKAIIDLVCEAAGGPYTYNGGEVKAVHAGLGVTNDDWKAAARLLNAALDKFEIPKKERDDLIKVVRPCKRKIIGKEVSYWGRLKNYF